MLFGMRKSCKVEVQSLSPREMPPKPAGLQGLRNADLVLEKMEQTGLGVDREEVTPLGLSGAGAAVSAGSPWE